MKNSRYEWTKEKDDICRKYYPTLGGAGIIEAGYITDVENAKAINTHCRNVLRLSCDISAINKRGYKVSKERGTHVPGTGGARKRGKDKGKREHQEPEQFPGLKQYAGCNSIFSLGSS